MSSSREGVLLRGWSAQQATSSQAPVPPQPSPEDRRGTIRRAADLPVTGNGPSFRLRDVPARDPGRLRARAHAEGFAAVHAQGMTAAAGVIAEAERAAADRMVE